MYTHRYHLQINHNPLFHHYNIPNKIESTYRDRKISLASQNNLKMDPTLPTKQQEGYSLHNNKMPYHSKSQAKMVTNDNPQSQNLNDIKNYLHEVYNVPIRVKTKGQVNEQKNNIINAIDSLSSIESYQVFEKRMKDRVQEGYKKALEKDIQQKQTRLKIKVQKEISRNKATYHKISSYNQFFYNAIAQKQKTYQEYQKYMQREELLQKNINKSKLLNLEKDGSNNRINAKFSHDLNELKIKHYRQSLQQQAYEKSKRVKQEIKTEQSNLGYPIFLPKAQNNIKYFQLNKIYNNGNHDNIKNFINN